MTEIVCYINGVPYTKKEWKLWKKQHTPEKPNVEKVKRYTLTDMVHEYTKAIERDLRVFKSITNYDKNGYRYWGTIVNVVLNMQEISRPFNKVCADIRKYNAILNEIQECRNKACLNDLLFQLTWALDDVETSLRKLVASIENSGVCFGLANFECINGKGKKLGLHTITIKARIAINKIKPYNEEILNLAKAL